MARKTKKKADVSQANGKENDNPIVNILKEKKNIILQGAPGTGKTYKTAELALAIVGCLPKRNPDDTEDAYHKQVMEEYKKRLINFDKKGEIMGDGQISFVTFHQSMDYEDFVEGIKPLISKTDNKAETKAISYDIVPGIFKEIVKISRNFTINELSKDVPVSEFEECWNRLLKNIKGQLIRERYVPLQTKTKDNYVFDVNDNETLIMGASPSTEGITVTRNQMESAWEKYIDEDLSKKGIVERIRKVTNRNPTACYAVFQELQKIRQGNTKKKNDEKNYVLIIDEINRGNVSKIFGELISLLEADKRDGGDHPLSVTLPYSKEKFSVPSNLYIIGTMNTTDRSVGSIDYAVRRRFAFVTLEADESLVLEDHARNLFNAVKNFIEKSKYDMDIEDLMVGHSYFMDSANLQMKWQYEILPLLMEYHKDGIISKSPLKDSADKDIADVKKNYANFTAAWKKPDSDTPN